MFLIKIELFSNYSHDYLVRSRLKWELNVQQKTNTITVYD